MPTVDLPLGPIDYRELGPDASDAPTAVFVHGFLVNGTLWDGVAEQLAAAGIRSVVPDWPLGAHRTPVDAGSELSPAAVGRAILDLLEALDLHDVVLVGSDTGGALCQLALRGDHHRVGGLVLTNCDAFEQFPPTFFVPLFAIAKSRAAVWFLGQSTRPRLLRHSPLAFGPLLRRPRSARLTRRWVEPLLQDRAIRADVARFAHGVDRKELLDAATWLSTFDRPTRLVWGMRDRHFTPALGRRLAAAFPQAELTPIDDATTFVSVDRPDAVASAITDVMAEVHRAGTT